MIKILHEIRVVIACQNDIGKSPACDSIPVDLIDRRGKAKARVCVGTIRGPL